MFELRRVHINTFQYFFLYDRLSVKFYEPSSDDTILLLQQEQNYNVDLSSAVYDDARISGIDSYACMVVGDNNTSGGIVAVPNGLDYQTSLPGIMATAGVERTELTATPKRRSRGRSFHKRLGRFLRKRLLCCVRPNTVEIL